MVNFFGHTPRFFKKVLYLSIAAHLIAIVVLGFYMRGSKKVFFTPVYTVSLVEPARHRARHVKKRRGVAIRKKSLKKHAIKKKAAKKTVALKKKKALVKRKKPAKSIEKDLSKALSAIREKVREEEEQRLIASKIETMKKRREAEELVKRLESIKNSLDAPPAGPEKKTKTTAPAMASSSGVKTADLELKHKAYFSLIRDRVQANWIYPENFDNEKISVIVSIRIGRDGTLQKSWVEKGSGNRQFDESLLKAVEKASPFPQLPEDFTEDTLETGLRFCPRCE